MTHRHTAHLAGAAALLLLGVPAALAAQCPDGSPPPCRAAARGAAPAVAPSDRMWLVLPFENTARVDEAELIRQASVSLLYGEMTRWDGIQVVPDDRVADLLAGVPVAERDRPGLQTALALARTAGAGRLVMGGYLAAGGRANLSARVYDTRSGRQLRLVRDQVAGYASAAALDSLGASFGRLASGILDLPPAPGSATTGVGTTSIEAYRAYAAGLEAVNRLAMDSVQRSFDRAITLDPEFALAHLQRWRFAISQEAGRPHLDAAIRLSASLPPRERALVDGADAQRRNDRAPACRAAGELLAADSADADGWALLSWCQLDGFLIQDGARVRPRGDLNRALRAAERAYALAPNTIQALVALVNALAQGSFMQCVPPGSGACPPERNYRVSLLTAGESLAVTVAPWSEVRHAPPDLAPAAVEGQGRRFARAAGILERLALRSDNRAVAATAARLAMAAGEIDRAASRIGRGSASAFDTMPSNRAEYLRTRFELALAQESTTVFRAYADSNAAIPGFPFQYRSMMGRFREGTDTSLANSENTAWRPILAGVLPPGVDTLEQRIAARLTGPARDDFLQLTTLAGFHLRRTGPALDTAARHPLKRYQALFARGDIARARAALAEFDRELLARHVNTPDDGGWLFSAESHLELADTTAAFARMQEFARRWPTGIVGAWILEMRYFQSTTPRLWGRAWLLCGDLAMARDAPALARRAYRMVVGLWDGGDPPVQPMVARAQSALAQLGN